MVVSGKLSMPICSAFQCNIPASSGTGPVRPQGTPAGAQSNRIQQGNGLDDVPLDRFYNKIIIFSIICLQTKTLNRQKTSEARRSYRKKQS